MVWRCGVFATKAGGPKVRAKGFWSWMVQRAARVEVCGAWFVELLEGLRAWMKAVLVRWRVR